MFFILVLINKEEREVIRKREKKKEIRKLLEKKKKSAYCFRFCSWIEMAAEVQTQPQVQEVNAASSGGAQTVRSLYVGDLDANVTDSQLYDLFTQIGEVVSVRVCKDLTSRQSLGYGYVNYFNPKDGSSLLSYLFLLIKVIQSVLKLIDLV